MSKIFPLTEGPPPPKPETGTPPPQPETGTPPNLRLGTPPKPETGTPPEPETGYPPLNVNRQTPVKTVPSRRTTYAGGKYYVYTPEMTAIRSGLCATLIFSQ